MPNRRQFIKDVASATAGIFFTGCSLFETTAFAQQQRGGTGKRREVMVGGRRVRTVDVHCHCFIREAVDMVKGYDQAKSLASSLDTPEGKKLNLVSIQDRLRDMDEQGIDIQALGLASTHFHYWADRDLATKLVKFQNEKLAELHAAYPDRFAPLATVAMQHPDLAVEQLEYAMKKLGMRGIMINANVNGEELASPKFHAFLAKAEELGAFVFMHPSGVPEADRRFQGTGRLNNVVGNPLDTAVALSHMIFEGTLDRFPGLKLCAAHGGGFLASYSGRSDHCAEFDTACKPVKKRPSEYLKQLCFDSLVYTGEGLRHLVAEVGADRVLLGTDYPYIMGNTDGVNHILNTPGLSDADKRAILGGNAAKLLGLGR